MCIKKAAERKRVPTSYKKGSSPSRKSKYNTAGGRHLRREHNSLSLNVDRGKTWRAPGLALFETWDSTVLSIFGVCLMVLPSRRGFPSQPAPDGHHAFPTLPV